MGSIPGSGRSPGEGNGNPLQYSCLENSMDRGVWRGYLQSMELQRVRHNLSMLACVCIYIYIHTYTHIGIKNA